ncbi:MAG: DMT family transporter [Oscillospiraceae bacterium]|nr:DMT family transporter [Oscillospiraceae bacterium]
MTKTENNILLFSITLCWASSYVFIKSLPPDFSSFAYLTLTTGIAAVILVAVFWRRLRDIKVSTLKRSFVLSLILTANLLAEKRGVMLLPASNASFLAALTILVVPLLMLLLRKKPTKNNMAGAGIIILGLFLTNRFSMSAFVNTGTLYVMLGCFCSAIYILSADRFTKQENPLLIGVTQMIFTALFGFVLWLFENPATFFSVNYTRELLSSIFILAFFTKAYAYILLMFSQKYADPMRVTIIASTEPVVTLTLAVLIPAAYGTSESFNIFSLFGALIIAIGAVVAGSGFMSSRKKAERTELHAD